jgi:hypothetical protein
MIKTNNSLRFPANKVEVEINCGHALKGNFKLGKIIPCADGDFMIDCEHFKIPLMTYYKSLDEAKVAAQQYFEDWVNGFIFEEQI